MRILAVVTAAIVVSQAVLAQPALITGIDFVVGFKTLSGKQITIPDCRIAGTDASFIRCETGNGSASYAVDGATMDREDFRWALTNCPTGSRSKPACQVRIQGEVADAALPRIINARIAK